MYDFKTSIDRTGTGAIKIDFAPEPVKGSGLVPLTIADQEFAVAPEIVEAVKKAADRRVFGYTYADPEYKVAVLGWMKRRHNWDAEGFRLFATNGVVPALALAVLALTQPGDGVVIQSPVYMQFAHAVRSNDRRIVENRLVEHDGRYEMDYADLDEKTRPDDVKLLLLCSPHNPVGRVWTEDELKRLGDICVRNNVVIVADEIHNDLLMNGAQHTVFANVPGMADHAVICTAASKTFNLAGLGCSNIFIKNEGLAEKFHAVCDRLGGGLVPYFARAATIAAYNECGQWVDELCSAVYSNFRMLRSFVEANLPMLRVIPLEGTYLAWLDMNALGLDNKQLAEHMLKFGLAFDEGDLFGENGSGFERWNLALPQDKLVVALFALRKAVEALKK